LCVKNKRSPALLTQEQEQDNDDDRRRQQQQRQLEPTKEQRGDREKRGGKRGHCGKLQLHNASEDSVQKKQQKLLVVRIDVLGKIRSVKSIDVRRHR
jgi:hypothetical protein